MHQNYNPVIELFWTVHNEYTFGTKYILLLILLYFYSSYNLNAGLISEYYFTVELLLQLILLSTKYLSTSLRMYIQLKFRCIVKFYF